VSVKSALVAVALATVALDARAQTTQAPAAQTAVPTIVLDSFDSVSQWTATPADGVELSIHADSSGLHGSSMRLDFDFHGHGGYAVAHRALTLVLPANYEFSFAIRGNAPTNTLEFKLVDSTGENVWWSNNPNFGFPKDWKTVTRKKRQISFAWGPTTDKQLTRFAAIEIAITAGSGGKGSVWLDDLALTPLDPNTTYNLSPRVSASSQAEGYDVSRLLDPNPTTSWRSAPARAVASTGNATTIQQGDSVDIDFLKRREFSGLVIDWEPGRRAASYDVRGSADGTSWQTLYTVNRTSPAPSGTSTANTSTTSRPLRDYLFLPESDDRYLRIVLRSAENRNGYGIRDLSVKPLDWAATENDFVMAVAKDAPRGSYPREFTNEQSYWTVVGVDRDSAEALINQDGLVEVGRGQFSIEPFLYVDGRLVTWNDAKISVAGDPESLPLPRVNWTAGDVDLSIAPFAAGPVDSSVLYVRYRVSNNSRKYKKLTLYLAVRPFQVNPPWQFLNLAGGVARIDTIVPQGSAVRFTGNKFVRPLAAPSGFGAVKFDDGNIVDWLRSARLPSGTTVIDSSGLASAVFAYQLELGPHATSTPIDVAVPLHGSDLRMTQLFPSSAASRAPATAPTTAAGTAPNPSASDGAITTLLPGQGERGVSAQLERVQADWREKLGRVSITLPVSASRYTQTMRTQLADILINRDGPAIQPGSRSYSRS
jgi:hypothetical protein